MRRALVIAYFLCAGSAWSQELQVTGRVKDKETGKALPFSVIRTWRGAEGTNADVNGNFRLAWHGDPLTLIVSYLGYVNDTVLVVDPVKPCQVFLTADGKQLNEVVVTGVSKATSIKENPLAIISIPQKLIERTAESNIIDALVKNTPGLNSVKTGPNISKPFIRGLGYNRVLTLYDGVRQEGQQWGDEHGIEVDAYNIEKAEVIKGPASLLYGSDALAGVVSLMPYIPRERDSVLRGKVFNEYQSNNGMIGQGLRLGCSNGRWLFALRGSYRIAKNYTNVVDGRVYNTSFRENNVSALAGYENEKGYSRVNFTFYNNLQGIPDGTRDSASRKFTKQIYETVSDTLSKRLIVSDDELNRYALSALHQEIQHMRFYNNNHYRVGPGEIDLLLAYQQNIRKEFNHPSNVSLPGMSVRLRTVNYGIRYNAPRFLNIESTIGVNGMYQANKNLDGTTFPIPDHNLLDAGAFIFAKWSSVKWSVTGGVRYDERILHGNEFYVRTDPGSNFDQHVHAPDTAGARLQFPEFEQNFGGLSSSLGITWIASRHISLKANVARGYRAPNISEIASNGLDPGAHIVYIGNKNFAPEFSFQQDLGMLIDHRSVTGSVSVFNNFMQNYIYLAQVADAQGKPVVVIPGNKTFQYQQSSAQLYGMEASLDLYPAALNGVTFRNNISILYGYNTSIPYHGTGIEGEYLPFIPPAKLLSALTKEFRMNKRVIKMISCRAEVDHNAAQHRFMALYQTETFTPAYTLFNAGIEAELSYTPKNSFRLYLQVNNLFDAAYQSNLSRLKYFEYYSSSPHGRAGIYSIGRNFCLKLVVDL